MSSLTWEEGRRGGEGRGGEGRGEEEELALEIGVKFCYLCVSGDGGSLINEVIPVAPDAASLLEEVVKHSTPLREQVVLEKGRGGGE